jgi:hypothetical protein
MNYSNWSVNELFNWLVNELFNWSVNELSSFLPGRREKGKWQAWFGSGPHVGSFFVLSPIIVPVHHIVHTYPSRGGVHID